MGNTRHFKKIRYTKEIVHAKMCTIRNSKDLTEEEEIKKRIHRRTV